MKTRDGKDHGDKNSACWDRGRSLKGYGLLPLGPLRRMRAVTGCMAFLFVLCVPAVSAQPVHPSAHTRILGRYVASPVALGNSGPNGPSYLPLYPACRALAANFNQFRNVPFGSKNPRLSSKYPQFRRLHWTPMAWNGQLAKEVFTGCPQGVCKKGSGWGPVWRYWLHATRALRQAGKPVLWRTSIDLINNGRYETIIRLEHILPYTFVRGRFVPEPIPPYSPYIDSKLYMLPSPDPQVAKVFNGSFMWGWHVGWKQGVFNWPTDLIENTQDKKYPYYILSWRRVGHRGDGVIGVGILQWSGDGYGPPGYIPVPLCNIKWFAKRAGPAQ